MFLTEGADKIHRGAFFSFLCDWTVKIRQEGGTMGVGEDMQQKGPSQDLNQATVLSLVEPRPGELNGPPARCISI